MYRGQSVVDLKILTYNHYKNKAKIKILSQYPCGQYSWESIESEDLQGEVSSCEDLHSWFSHFATIWTLGKWPNYTRLFLLLKKGGGREKWELSE